MTKENFYNILTTIIDPAVFRQDDLNKKISIRLPLKEENIKDFRKNILLMFGNPHIPAHNWDDDLIHNAYKFCAHYIDIDEQTIKYDKYGRLYADLGYITNELITNDNITDLFNKLDIKYSANLYYRSIKNIIKNIIEDPIHLDTVKDLLIHFSSHPEDVNNIIDKLAKTFLDEDRTMIAYCKHETTS